MGWGCRGWVRGHLTVMAGLMGVGVGVSGSGTTRVAVGRSLVGQLVFGALLGVTYRRLQSRAGGPSLSSGQATAA